MKRKLSISVASLLVCAVLASCSTEQQTVATDGSTSMEKVIGVLGETFEVETGISVTYNPTGSGSGIKAVAAGTCDIGLSSRHLKDEETAQGLTETVFAYDGIALIVHPENPVDDLDIDTIARIYTGEIVNWNEIGGNDAEIVLIGREGGSGTRDGFESITGTSDQCKYRQELTSTIERRTEIRSAIENAVSMGHSEIRIRRNDREYQLDISRIETGGEKVGTVILCFDITEQANAERLRREFSANVSHELKTPLQSISGSAELIENGLVKQEDLPRFVGHKT
ncbi:MAG: substrate-binding domain-containing protein [Oscillospiraceae bacterium]|nr:substrate-binding domain-containing protein [Oscillospiraceae bacterium]